MLSAGGVARGIACDEKTAVCIDSTGKATVYGGYPAYDDNAYFIQVNCALPNTPEVLGTGQPLTWNRNQEAIKTYNIKGDTSGSHWFNVNDWQQGSGGTWQNWYVLNGTFNSAAGTPPCNSLPLHLLTFTATISKQSVLGSHQAVQLNWTSENEQFFDHYEVERSSNGREFFQMQNVKSKMQNGEKNDYEYIDITPTKNEKPETRNQNYYRLKMVDKDGSFTYSKTEKVEFRILSNEFRITPNPATTQVQLQFNKGLTGKVQIEVSDVTGKVVMKKVFNGGDALILSTSKLAAGSYVVKVGCSGEEFVQKMIIK